MSTRGDHTRSTIEESARRPFRAVDVLSGSIDRRTPSREGRTRKQISAQLEPGQIRLLGELHARLNANATSRIEKSDLVGLGIELLAAALAGLDQGVASAPDEQSPGTEIEETEPRFRDVQQLRTYVRTQIRDGELP